jgi:hypothetical protein
MVMKIVLKIKTRIMMVMSLVLMIKNSMIGLQTAQIVKIKLKTSVLLWKSKKSTDQK